MLTNTITRKQNMTICCCCTIPGHTIWLGCLRAKAYASTENVN